MPEPSSGFGAGLSNLLPFRLRSHPKPVVLKIDTSPSALDKTPPAPAASGEQATTPKAESSEITPRHPEPSRFPESLHFDPVSLRGRSPSINSSVFSATLPDSSSATFSYSSLVSPISTSYASEVQEMLAGSRPSSRLWHRHKPSNGSCSAFTYVNDESEEDSLRGLKWVPWDDIQEEELEIGSTVSHDPAKEQVGNPDAALGQAKHPSAASEPAPPAQDDVASDTSDDFHPENAESILDFTLQLIYGVELRETSIAPATAHQLVQRFVQDLGRHVWHSPSDGNESQSGQPSFASSYSTPSTGNHSFDGSRAGGKRKKLGGREDDDGDLSDGEGGGDLPLKKPKPTPAEENLRLSCPYRKRNPHRFNVRDHHSCAMTYFPKFAELRQHIVKQHKRDDPSAFVCDRCNRDFLSRKDLRDHQRLPREQMCDISDHDPEAGIDGPTSNKLLSRKRASGASPEVQWREIWNIVFPDDDDNRIQAYHFVPVIEHFELETHYLSAFHSLHASLLDKISNPVTLETLAAKFQQCFVETVDRCTVAAQDMPYTNRSNKRNEPAKGHSILSPQRLSAAYDGITAGAGAGAGAEIPGMQGMVVAVQQRTKKIMPRPDSGVVIDDDDVDDDDDGGGGGGGGGGDDEGEEEEEGQSSTGGDVSLKHKHSIRTVRGSGVVLAKREPSDINPPTAAEAVAAGPPPTSPSHFFDDSVYPLGNSSSGSGFPMESSAVVNWSNGVVCPQAGPEQESEEVGGHFADSYLTTVGPQFGDDGCMNWTEMYQVNFTMMGEGFTGFHGK